MKTFTIDSENHISIFATEIEAAAASSTPFDTFTSEQELDAVAASWPAERLIAIWNGLPGVAPVKKFKDLKTAIGMIWTRLQSLGESAIPKSLPPTKPTAARKVKVVAPTAKAAPAKSKVAKKAMPAKAMAKGEKRAKTQGTAARGGTKTAAVLALLQRRNGATISEIMQKMAWQRHTVRGFMAGPIKKAGYTVESFRPEGGERTYRLPK